MNFRNSILYKVNDKVYQVKELQNNDLFDITTTHEEIVELVNETYLRFEPVHLILFYIFYGWSVIEEMNVDVNQLISIKSCKYYGIDFIHGKSMPYKDFITLADYLKMEGINPKKYNLKYSIEVKFIESRLFTKYLSEIICSYWF